MMKSSMGLMSDGMAVAMYTTLAGLVGSILLKIQYYMLDNRDREGVLARGHAHRDARRSRAGTGARSWNARMIDEFGLYPREEPFDPFSVMLFKALQVVAFLFFLALLAISPEAKDGKIDSKAEFIVTMDWPDNHPDDLDLFVQDPAGNIAWYRHREAGFMVLDRDDRGGANDFIVVNGKKISSPIREEIVTIRGVIRRRIHRQRQPFPGDDRLAGAGEGEGAKAQSDRAGGFRRHGLRRSHRRREDRRALHPRRRGQGHRRQSPAEVADGDLSQCAPQRRRSRPENRLREAAVTNLAAVIIWLSIAYALLGVLLLVICVFARVPWPVKAGAIVLTSAFYVVSFFATRGLLGWSSIDPLPPKFKLLGARIVEPHSLEGDPGAIHLWVEALDDDNFPERRASRLSSAL